MDQQENNIYIFLDQSTSHCGYSVWNNDKLIGHGVYSPKGKDSTLKTHDLEIWFTDLYEYCRTKGNIIEINLEDIQFQKSINGNSKGFVASDGNVLTYKVLARLQGVLIESCIQKNVPWNLIAPSHWKSKCGIKSHYRRDQKKECCDIVKERYGLDVTDDEADAVCMGYSRLVIGE